MIHFLHYGNSLVLFKKCMNIREEFIPYLKFIGFVDLVCINTLIFEDDFTLVNYMIHIKSLN